MTSKSSSVSSRFVSQSDLEAARSNSNTTSAEEYDPRSLFEKLQANKQEKDAKYDELYKLSNQFRGIDEGESEFLAQVKAEKMREELEKARREKEELELFRAAKAGKVEGTESVSHSNGGVKRKDEIKADDHGSTKDKMVGGGKASSKKRKGNSSTLLGVVKKKKSASGPTAVEENMVKSTSSTTHPSTSPSNASKSASSSSTATQQTNEDAKANKS
ncbi:related to NEFA-interacting nuclear protein NIP30 [Ustilago trichophora]|uniref:Related to NEFA-interacting nuclear protein NIP30 n=1 Tax=Ustilago trichophora TaxID=86804 RepID=A0A5C3EPY3_9BASI|nr:related to NEFA-interacting nuclear protein NIP30 [Ustilago trichophora]